jgi:hypothetical protein
MSAGLCQSCLSLQARDQPTATCVLCGEPTNVDQGELAYQTICAEDLLRHGQCDSQQVDQ